MGTRNSGMSLLEVLIAMAIGSMSVLALMQMNSVQQVVQKKTQERLDRIQLRASIHSRVNCGLTLAAVCGHRLPVLLTNGAPLTLAYKFGGRHVEIMPFCADGGVYVNYAYMKDHQLAADLVTGEKAGFRPLFPGPLCMSQTRPQRTCSKSQKSTGYDFDTKRYTCSSL